MFNSVIQQAGPVLFPHWAGERHYMVPFRQEIGLPAHLEHWQKTVDQMLVGVESDKPIYFMADQSFVKAGASQRRPGIHVDGYWVPDLKAHGGGGHSGVGYGGHTGFRRHRGVGGHSGRHMSGDWESVDFSEPEALILASDVEGAKAYIGEYDPAFVKNGGDYSLGDVSLLEEVLLKPYRTYVGDVGTLHESIPVLTDSYRTMVRLNVPGVRIH